LNPARTYSPPTELANRLTRESPPNPLFGRREAALYFGIVILWGTSWIALRWQLGNIPPEVSVFWRFLAAATIMFALAVWRRERLRFSVADHGVFALMGCGLFSLNFLSFYHAGLYVPSGLLAVMFSLASVGNLVIAALVTRRLPRPRMAIGGLMGVTGVALMYLPQLSRGTGGGAMGLMFGALGTTCFCLGNLASLAARRRGASLVSSSAWGMFYGCLVLGAICLARDVTFGFDWTPAYLLSFVWLAGPCSVGAFLVYLALVDRIGAPRAAYATVLFPVVSLTISTFAETYAWTPFAIVGVAFALIGNVAMLARSL
jgi:drug/metabolite transporter (DMT)-like permease